MEEYKLINVRELARNLAYPEYAEAISSLSQKYLYDEIEEGNYVLKPQFVELHTRLVEEKIEMILQYSQTGK